VIESFVDLTYRGLALGRRIKLTQVRPTTGYLELPMPMPVGTLVAISTDEGVTLEATVTQIHEQVGGSERVPGMTVKPQLGGEAALGWWKARVALPETDAHDDQPPSRSRPVTVRPRSHTVPQAVPEKPVEQVKEAPLSTEVTSTKELSVYVAEQPVAPPPEPVAVPQYEAHAEHRKEKIDDKRTTVMEAVDQEMLAKLTQSEGEVERLTRSTGEHAVIDDGLRTTVMDAVDPAALGLDVTASGSFRAAQSQEMDVIDDDDNGDKSSPTNKTPPSGVKKRKKRR
jgi:hypothetical protein